MKGSGSCLFAMKIKLLQSLSLSYFPIYLLIDGAPSVARATDKIFTMLTVDPEEESQNLASTEFQSPASTEFISCFTLLISNFSMP